MENLPLLINSAKWAIVSIGLLYLLFCFGLSMLAAKLRHAHAWIAWIPLVNLYLLCRLAGSSAFLILLALIPVINLLVFAILGVRIASRAGKSSLLGLMLGFPVLGAFIPLLLAIGGTRPALADGQKEGMAPLSYALINAGIAAGLLILAGVGFKVAGQLTERVIPTAEQATAVLPKRMAGTLTEFPIDSSTDHPAVPSNVVTKNFSESGAASDVSAEKLPPWVSPESLSSMAEDATFADYHSDNSNSSVNVVTLTMKDGSAGLSPPTQTELDQLGQDAKISGVELNSSAGVAYKGYHVTTPEASYYALQRPDTNTAVIISARNQASIEIAERLASNIGNGQGLLEFDQYRSSFGQIPPTPEGANMNHMQTFTEDDIALWMQEVNKDIAKEQLDSEMASMIEMARAVVPSNVTVATYSTPSDKHIYGAAVAGYSSSSVSWTALQTIAVLQSVLPGKIPAEIQQDLPFTYSLQPVEVGDSSGYSIDINSKNGEGNGSAVLLRRGASIVLMGGSNYTTGQLMPWIQHYVSGK